MATKKSPVARQKDEYGSKEKLVDRVIAVMGQIEKSDEDKDEQKARFLAASNKKLLRLIDVGTEVKQKFGSLDKLAAALAEVEGRSKDKAYVEKLGKLSATRLLDLHQAAEKRGKKKAA